MDEIKRPEHFAEYIRNTKRVFVPFVAFNYLCRWLAYLLDKAAIFKVLEFVSILSILVAVYFYLAGSGDRQKTKHFQAWQIITLAQGKPSDAGRRMAILDLYSDRVSLDGIDLSFANLPNLNIPGAKFYQGKFIKAHLENSNFSYADMINGDFSNAVLVNSNFRHAFLAGANFSEAFLLDADLSDTSLIIADFSKAFLDGADLSNAYLAQIKGWETIQDISSANIYGVKNPPEGFVEWATQNGAVSIENKNEWKNIKEKRRMPHS
jgi:hypothetical protein